MGAQRRARPLEGGSIDVPIEIDPGDDVDGGGELEEAGVDAGIARLEPLVEQLAGWLARTRRRRSCARTAAPGLTS
eukprot:2434230-Alexandrium_andersonii.AAC.1